MDWSLHKKIWLMVWPPLLSNITTPLLGLVDTAVVGHLDTPVHLGAVALGASIVSFLFWSFGFLRMGVTGLTAQAVGREDPQAVRHLLFQSLILAVAIGLALILVRKPVIEAALYLMAPSAEVLPWARAYCEVRIYSAPAVLAGYVLMGWFFGIQYAKGTLWILLVINLSNMVLDYLAVYYLNLASPGVAWATVASNYLGVLFALLLAGKKLALFESRLVTALLVRWQHYIELIQINRYLFVRTVLLLLVMSFFTSQGARQGDSILAANAVLMTFLMIIASALDGFAFAVEALCGESFGRRQREQFIKIIQLATYWAWLVSLLLALAAWAFGGTLIALLTNIETVQEEAKRYLPWLIALPLISMWSFMLDGIFVATTSARQMQNTMIISALCIFFPVWYLTLPLGNHGLWLSMTALFVARAVTLGWCMQRNLKRGLWF